MSVVIPVYNEEDALPFLVHRLRPVLDGLGEPYEVLAVDDGSRDASAAYLAATRAHWPQLRVIRLVRNFGHQAALTAGLLRAAGRYVVSMDADLQDPPEVIPRMVALARAEELSVVYGVREDRTSDTVFKRWSAALYYRLMRRLVTDRVPTQAGDFRLLRRDAIEILRDIPTQRVVLRLLIAWLGLPGGEVRYQRGERVAGRTKYPLRRMVKLAVDGLASFSSAPLRIATWLGLTGVVVATALAVMALVAYLRGAVVSGWTSIFLAVLLFGAVQLLCLGLLGEYVGGIFEALQGRPRFLIASDTDPAGTGRTARPEPVPDLEPVPDVGTKVLHAVPVPRRPR